MILRSFGLDGKVALVTGASRGMGRAIALGLAEAGADVALVSRSAGALEEVAAQARSLGRRARTFPADLARTPEVERVVEATVAEMGQIDILVNAAGVGLRKPTVELTEQDFDSVYDINIKAVTFACAAAGRHFLRQRSGKIVNIGSLTTFFGLPRRALYGGTKGAVGQLTRSLAVEWAPYGVCVNALAPGWIDTEMAKPVLADREFHDAIIRRTPMGRLGQPEDVVGTAVFLSSAASDFVTGQIIWVDGGYLACCV